MPRVTRARTAEIQEESDLAASTPLPFTPTRGRAPLGETSNNKVKEPELVNTSEEKMVPAKKIKGKKGNSTKKASKQKKEKNGEPGMEVLEDGNESTTSSAVEEACKDLLKDNPDNQQTIVGDQLQQTPTSAAVNTASQQLSPKAGTPYFGPEIHKADELATTDTTQDKEDSFVVKIETRTPAKMTSNEGMDTQPAVESKDDSFIEQIESHSPNKRISRIEDSVEALDALEEEIEKVGELIPTTTNNLQSPVKTKEQVLAPSKAPEKKPSGSLRLKNSAAIAPKSLAKHSSTNVRSATSRPSIQHAAKKVTVPKNSLSQEKPEADYKSPAPVGAAGVPAPSALGKKRVNSVHKPPFQPTKSTKPPTRASFELPGDAISRKLKEQREERQKHEEEEKNKQRVFKARPVRLSHAPEVKLTAAAKLRLSMAKGVPAPAIVTTSTQGAPNAKPGLPAGSMAPRDGNKRLSTLTVAKRNILKPAANSSARVTRGPSFGASTASRNPSASGAPRPAPTAADLAHQKVKGKEVFGRTKVEIQEREKAKKDKEEAAKKARFDAAERGRIASREWAEKQKARKMEAERAKQIAA